MSAPPAPAPAWALPALLAAAVLGGLSMDLIGPAGRINILAPPVLALIAWNLLVYAVLAMRSLAARPASRGWSPLLRAARAIGADTSAPLFEARVARAFHLAAAVLALAMLASLYARGLAFEYRAGWDSTFLDAPAVRRILGVVLGPAAAFSGIGLPSAGELELLRFSRGPGENAARWIHLHALTVLAIVVLPRLLLAAWAASSARRLARRRALEPDAHDRIAVVPYGYRAAGQRQRSLRRELIRRFGRPVDPVLAPDVPLGGEDTLAASHPALPPNTGDELPIVLLFPLSATPERESQLAFVQAARACWPGRNLLAWVDGSGFRERLDAAAAASRIEQRRAAWRQALAELPGPAVPLEFVDLEPDDD